MASPKTRKPTEKAVLRKIAKGTKLVGEEAAIYAGYIERLRINRVSDLNRWSSDKVFPAGWNERTTAMAALLPAHIKSVADFGCGAMALRDCLAKGVTYIPIDLVSRGVDTVVLDLNEETLPPLPRADVAFFSGTLEYVVDLHRLIAALCKTYRSVICSYVTVNCAATDIAKRRAFGWVNDLRLSELLAMFEEHDFSVLKLERWQHQSLLFLRRNDTVEPQHPAAASAGGEIVSEPLETGPGTAGQGLPDVL